MIEINNLVFSWPKHPAPTLDIAELTISQGERIFLHGPSGSGKSTLLGLLAGINAIQAGDIKILDTPMRQLSAAKRDQFRADHIGTIFQNFNLLPFLDPIENVMLGCQYSKMRKSKLTQSLQQSAISLLENLGIDHTLQAKSVSELSIGQQQRVAAARAFIGQPELIIADEPTSALDADSREAFIETLFNQAEKYQATILFVSHDHSLAQLFDRKVSLNEINGAAQ
ncbi:ABC transporter ATP-binding protein [Pseudoalteromonas sp. SS15]|uniref:ABC transporter ATP-binding protein n=1 Tax=Pseudoalteromonas sp. SS15 TaxID=3139393 RepID=UPI003BAB1691